MHGFTGATISFVAARGLMTGVVSALTGSTVVVEYVVIVGVAGNHQAFGVRTCPKIVVTYSQASIAAAMGASRFEETRCLNPQLFPQTCTSASTLSLRYSARTYAALSTNVVLAIVVAIVGS